MLSMQNKNFADGAQRSLVSGDVTPKGQMIGRLLVPTQYHGPGAPKRIPNDDDDQDDSDFMFGAVPMFEHPPAFKEELKVIQETTKK